MIYLCSYRISIILLLWYVYLSPPPPKPPSPTPSAAYDSLAVGGEWGGADFFAPRESESHRIASPPPPPPQPPPRATIFTSVSRVLVRVTCPRSRISSSSCRPSFFTTNRSRPTIPAPEKHFRFPALCRRLGNRRRFFKFFFFYQFCTSGVRFTNTKRIRRECNYKFIIY